jgi:hypothetical protein
MRFVQEETNTKMQVGVYNKSKKVSLCFPFTHKNLFFLDSWYIRFRNQQQTAEAFETIRLMESLHLMGDELS